MPRAILVVSSASDEAEHHLDRHGADGEETVLATPARTSASRGSTANCSQPDEVPLRLALHPTDARTDIASSSPIGTSASNR